MTPVGTTATTPQGRSTWVRPLSTSTVAPRWSALHASARPWDPPRVPTLVVVPHPDDEVLLAGGLIATQRERGVDVHVIGVTDGEAGLPLRVPARDLGQVRRREQAEALCTLGVSRLLITRARASRRGGVEARVRTGRADPRDGGRLPPGRRAVDERPSRRPRSLRPSCGQRSGRDGCHLDVRAVLGVARSRSTGWSSGARSWA